MAWTKSGTAYTTDGSQADVTSALTNASSGNVVNIPAGSFTWGASNSSLAIPANVTLQGAGTNSTTVVLADNGPTSGSGVMALSAGSAVRDFAITGSSVNLVTAFAIDAVAGWRITDIAYHGGAANAYFIYIDDGAYGLIDNCNIYSSGNGTAELIFGRGPSNSWQTPDSLGTTNAVYIESCVFGGQGYVCDANSNARFVIRSCVVNGQMKVDGHGKASNTPPRGVRHLEIYDNYWSVAAFATSIEIRGGTGMCFDNTNAAADGNKDWMYLREYGCEAQWPNFTNIFQTPVNYPVCDQIGVGEDPEVAASDPYYLWNNSASGTDWFLQWQPAAAGAITLYGSSFTEQTLIAADRDYFRGALGSTFDGSTGVGRGTKAQMLAITPSKTGVGFWVTNESSWNTRLPANTSGQLYRWSGSAWVLKYTPLTYPHPLTTLSQSTNSTGGISPPMIIKRHYHKKLSEYFAGSAIVKR
jgi:hypothetical protein